MAGRPSRGLSSKAIVGIIVVLVIVAAAAAYLLYQPGRVETYQVRILTGSTAGTYYPVGTTYAKLLNQYSGGRIDARALEAKASVGNIKDLCAGNAEAALAQNDISYYAYQGTTLEAFQGNPQKCIRAVGVLYPETIQIVVLADSPIKTIWDLEGRKVAVGAAGSGTYWNARQILEEAGLWGKIKAEYKTFAEAAEDLKLGNIDAAFITAGIPTSAIEQLAAEKPIRLIEVPDEIYQKLKAKYPFYTRVTVEAGTYTGLRESVKTVAVMSMLLVRADLPEDVVYQMTKILYEHANELKQEVKIKSVTYISLEHALDGLSIPLHPGAYRFYQEKGMSVPEQFRPPTS